MSDTSDTSAPDANRGLRKKLREQTRKVIRLLPRLENGNHDSENDVMRSMVERCEKKRLFVCCDGTWQNASGSVAPLTNVAKLARAVYRLGEDHFQVPEGDHNIDTDWGSGAEHDRYGVVRQIVYYSSGVGAASSLWSDSSFAGATGKGKLPPF
jgi:uncharacterized protein (DUF2235 family)